ncbi:MAG TPA: methyltransferase domain-containing protein [Propylenella sp.]
MHLDVVDLRDFYASPVGRMVIRHLGPVVASLVKVDAGTRVLGFGFAIPYLAEIRGAERLLAFMPAGQGVIDWPSGDGSATALVAEDSLPLPDSSIDLAIMIHALEMSARPQALMAELRRVLTSGGRLIIVVPNRQGAWASSDLSPFGFGRPYSRGQLRSLFAEVGFEAEAWTTALHMPPASWRPLLGAAGAFDRVGRVVWPAFAGVVVVAAVKRTVQGVPARARPRLAPALRPVLGPPAGAVGRLPP